jgi:plastocyanin
MRYHRPFVLALAALSIGVTGLAACRGGDDSSSDEAAATTAAPAAGTTAPAGTEAPAETEAAAGVDQIVIADGSFKFEPASLQVAAGTEVTWDNHDDLVPHRIASQDGSFDSENLHNGDQFSHTFDAAGEYPYVCGIHSQMTGTIVVT